MVMETIYKLRKKNPNYDGKEFWQPLKKILDEEIYGEKWKKINKKLESDIMKLPEYYIDGYENRYIIEINHFLIQHIRIPKNEKPSLKKIIQIALNAGQYKALGKDKIIGDRSYKKIKMDKLETYLTNGDIKSISDKITNELVKIVEKYLNKYKT
jgi:hypothetical protein